jgi:hypothetical protein
LKAVDATGLIATALDQSGLWDTFKIITKNYLNDKFGDPLYRFGTGEANVPLKEIAAESEKFAAVLATALQAIQGKEVGRKLETDEKEVLAEIVAAMEFGFMDDVAEEGRHNAPRQSETF